MTSEVARPAQPTTDGDGIRFEFADHNCFACGTLNTHGLRLQLHLEPGRSWTELALDRRFEGWEGIAHGGITTTILDEVMAWALVESDNWGVTARLNVQFRRPVPIGTPLRADGWLTKVRRRLLDTEAMIIEVATGIELATATGVYVAADADRKREILERYEFRRLDGPSLGSTS